jgi:hypothetical protein
MLGTRSEASPEENRSMFKKLIVSAVVAKLAPKVIRKLRQR